MCGVFYMHGNTTQVTWAHEDVECQDPDEWRETEEPIIGAYKMQVCQYRCK